MNQSPEETLFAAAAATSFILRLLGLRLRLVRLHQQTPALTFRPRGAATQLPMVSLETRSAKHVTVGFSPDGNFIVSRSVAQDPSDNGVYLWRAPSREEIDAAEAQDGVENKQP